MPAGLAGAASFLGPLLRASVVFFVAVGWLQACIASIVGIPLPPLLHLALQGSIVAGLSWRAPKGGANVRACGTTLRGTLLCLQPCPT